MIFCFFFVELSLLDQWMLSQHIIMKTRRYVIDQRSTIYLQNFKHKREGDLLYMQIQNNHTVG